MQFFARAGPLTETYNSRFANIADSMDLECHRWAIRLSGSPQPQKAFKEQDQLKALTDQALYAQPSGNDLRETFGEDVLLHNPSHCALSFSPLPRQSRTSGYIEKPKKTILQKNPTEEKVERLR